MGQATISNLFTTFDFGQLPDIVNQPTLDRLREFVAGDLNRKDIVIDPLTVRELVDEICKFNSSNTLCWELAHAHSGPKLAAAPPMYAAAAADSIDAAIKDTGDLHRVFARCAQPVKDEVTWVLEHLFAPQKQVKNESQV